MLKTNTRVLHVTRNVWMRCGQVEKAIQKNCSFVWIIPGRTFRDATYQEAAAMRVVQEKEPLGLCYTVEGKDGELIEKPFFAELPDLIFRPPANAEAATREEYRLAAEANRFAAENAA